MDSTGSNHMDSEVAKPTVGEEGGKIKGGRVNCDPQEAQSNRQEEVEKGEGEESGDSHAASPDSGHVMSPDLVTPVTPPPVLNERVKKCRSQSTEISLTTFQTQELNGDGSPNSSDEVFDTSSSQASSQESSDLQSCNSQQTPSKAISRSQTLLIRRKTVPSNIHRPMSTVGGTSLKSNGTSIISHAPSYGTSRKGYTNVAGTPQISLSIPIGSLKLLSGRRPSMALPRKKKIPLAGAGSPAHSSLPRLRVLKIVLSGNDLLVCHTAKAYAYLLVEEPNLFVGLDIRFYHVPLSTASGADWQTRELNSATDTLDAMLEQPNACGSDVNIGRYMSHLDSWYERNVALAVHHSLRLIPAVSATSNSLTSSARIHRTLCNLPSLFFTFSPVQLEHVQ